MGEPGIYQMNDEEWSKDRFKNQAVFVQKFLLLTSSILRFSKPYSYLGSTHCETQSGSALNFDGNGYEI